MTRQNSAHVQYRGSGIGLVSRCTNKSPKCRSLSDAGSVDGGWAPLAQTLGVQETQILLLETFFS